MHRSINRPTSDVAPVVHGLPPYARTYVGFVDSAHKYGITKGRYLIFFPALSGLNGHTTVAWDLEEAYSRARDLLILHADELDDPYAWAANIALVHAGTDKLVK